MSLPSFPSSFSVPEYGATLILSVLVLVLIVWIGRLEWRLSRILRGEKGGSLEGAIAQLQNGHGDLRTFQKTVEAYLKNAEMRLRRSVQRIETVRFNPFKGTGDGGNQSFATVFVNEEGDGVIVSSLYARDRMSIFTKPVSKFSSSHELTEEERQVLENARKSLAQ